VNTKLDFIRARVLDHSYSLLDVLFNDPFRSSHYTYLHINMTSPTAVGVAIIIQNMH
jgi:hypothetical protein